MIEPKDPATGSTPDKINVSTSKGWQERRERVAANIERVALDLFVKHGYPAVTVESVAKAVGCSVRTVTRQFPTKEDLLLTFHRRKNQAVLDEFARLSPGPDAVSAIWAAWTNMAEEAKADLHDYLLWMRVAASAPEVMDRVNGERRRDLQAALRAVIIGSLGADPHAEMKSQVLAGALEAANTSVVDYWIKRGGIDEFDELYRSAAEALAHLSTVFRPA